MLIIYCEPLMINILIHTHNSYLKIGLRHLIKDIFANMEGNYLCFHEQYSPQAAASADFIFTEMVVGEYFLCHDILNNQSNQATTFIFHPQKKEIPAGILPNCINSAVFLYSKDIIPRITKKIFQHLGRIPLTTGNDEFLLNKLRRCINCQCKSITPVQLKIIHATNAGLDNLDIAKALEMNYKTVFSHKQNIMIKFRISNKQEFNKFAHAFIKKK